MLILVIWTSSVTRTDNRTSAEMLNLFGLIVHVLDRHHKDGKELPRVKWF